MALLGRVIKRTIEIRDRIPKRKTPFQQQLKVLRSLLKKAQLTAFGEHYKFSQILHDKNIPKDFAATIPVHDYNSMFKKWWYRSLNGEPFVCWPGQIKYFAL